MQMQKPGILSTLILAALINSTVADRSLSRQAEAAHQRIEGFSGAVNRAASMFQEIVGWLSSNFELPPTHSAPKIEFASQVDLMKLRALDRAQWQGLRDALLAK